MSLTNLHGKARKTQRLKPLTPAQRKLLGFTLARKAWERLGIDESFDDWRRREAREATRHLTPDDGVTISEAMQFHFDVLFTHFKMLAGEATLADGQDDAQAMRQLSHSISVLQRQLGFSDAYLGGMIKRLTHGQRTWTTLNEGTKLLNALRYAAQRQAKRLEEVAS